MGDSETLEDYLKKNYHKNFETINNSGSLEGFLNSFAANLGAGRLFVPGNELANGACLYSSIGHSLRCFKPGVQQFDEEPAQSVMNTLRKHLDETNYGDLMKSMKGIAENKKYNYAARMQAAFVYKKKDIENEGKEWFERVQFLTNWDNINSSGLAFENYPETDILLLYAWFERINIGLINVSGNDTNIDGMAQKFYFGDENHKRLDCFLLFEGNHFKHICPNSGIDLKTIAVPEISEEKVNMANNDVNNFLQETFNPPNFRTDVEVFWYLYERGKPGFETLIKAKNMSDVLFVYARNMQSLQGSGSAEVAKKKNAQLQTFGITTGTTPGNMGGFEKLDQPVEESLLQDGLETRYPKDKYPSLRERVDNREKKKAETAPIIAESVISDNFEDLSKWIQNNSELKRVYFPGTKTKAGKVEWGTSIYNLDETIIQKLTNGVERIAQRFEAKLLVVDGDKVSSTPNASKLEDVSKKTVETSEDYAEYLENVYPIFQSMKIEDIYGHFQTSGL
jgi:hypothetical protein